MNTKTEFFTRTLLLWDLYCILYIRLELNLCFHYKKNRKELLLCTFIVEGLFG